MRDHVKPKPDSAESKAEDPPSGRRGLISQLFSDNNRALLNFLLTHLPDEQEAREVAQEAYVKLLQLDRPEAISFLRTYLFRIAANLAIDRLRRGKRKARIEQLDVFPDWTDDASVERGVLASQEVALLRQAIAELDPKSRHAFTQHKFSDRAIADIAREMSVTPRMARIYVARAILYCRLRLDGYAADAAARVAREMVS